MGGVAPYAFGDSVPAARRLALVAEAFEPSSRAFLERFAGATPALAVDLGCGPGHTILLLDEVEEIHTEHPVLRAYLDTVARLLTAGGRRLEVGHLLESLADPDDLRRVDSRLAVLSPPTPLVGAMFGLNLGVWRHDPLVAGVATSAVLDEIALGLRALADGEPASITWRLRQLAFERSPRGRR
jgi:hypothetical protein